MNAFDDLNDPLDELFNAGKAPAAAARPAVQPPASYKPPVFDEPCRKCGGSGQTRWGACFKCQGRGKRTFKTAPEQRAKNRAQAGARKTEKRASIQQQAEAFIAANAEVVAWLKAAQRRVDDRLGQGAKDWPFPREMFAAIYQYGSLTENQLAACRKLIARDAERAAERKASAPPSSAIDVSKIEAAFERARTEAHEAGAEGVRWLKLRLDTFVFLDMPAKGQWKAAIRVTEGETKLGRIEAGRLVRDRACTDEQLARILAAAADPVAAAKAYGLRYSSCSCCGRELTDPESIALGIGPICAGRWFGGV